MNLKNINFVIIIGSVLALLIAVVPVIFYFIQFKNSIISLEPSDWGAFGDFISGTSGTILSFFAVLFALVSLYFTTRIARIIQSDEFQFNEKQAEKELRLLHQQNKPYPYFDFIINEDLTSIVLQNNGVGTLIVTKWQIQNSDGKEFSNFHNLLNEKLTIQKSEIKIAFNTAENHVISPNGEKVLLKVTPYDVYNEIFAQVQDAIRQIIKETKIIIEFEDVFSNKSIMTKDLKFFGRIK